MELLERDRDLAILESALAEAASGSGAVVVVSGEAGIGKSAASMVGGLRNLVDAGWRRLTSTRRERQGLAA